MNSNSRLQDPTSPDEPLDPFIRAYRLVHRQGDLAAAEVIVRQLLATAVEKGKSALLNSATWLLHDINHHRQQVRQNGCYRHTAAVRPVSERPIFPV